MESRKRNWWIAAAVVISALLIGIGVVRGGSSASPDSNPDKFSTPDAGPITAQALVAKPRRGKDPTLKLLSRTFEAGTSEAEVDAQLAKWRERKNVVAADRSVSPTPSTAAPNDPAWAIPNRFMPSPNSALPMARIGACCTKNGLLDTWGLPATSSGQVNVAIIDGGWIRSNDPTDGYNDQMHTELAGSFLGEWDEDNRNSAIGRPISELKPVENSDRRTKNLLHGMHVAQTMLGKANNRTSSAGVTGPRTDIKWGSFRTDFYSGVEHRPLTVAQALTTIYQHNQQAIEGKQATAWSVVTMSFGTYQNSLVWSELFERLTKQGVLLVSAGGNSRDSYQASRNGPPRWELGKNAVEWPAADPYVLSVANYGDYDRPLPGDTLTLSDATHHTSSSNPFVDLVAPGVLSPVSQFGMDVGVTGSSFSAASIAGLAAQVIATNQNTFRCIHAADETRRLNCVTELRKRLLGSTVPVGTRDSEETPETQGIGLIDANALLLDVPYKVIPPTPKQFKVFATRIAVDDQEETETIEYAATWRRVGPTATYRYYFDGDGTFLVQPDQLDPTITAPVGTGLNMRVPQLWSAYRIPYDPLPAGTTQFAAQVMVSQPERPPGRRQPLGESVHTFQLTASLETFYGKRAAQSLPATARCRLHQLNVRVECEIG